MFCFALFFSSPVSVLSVISVLFVIIVLAIVKNDHSHELYFFQHFLLSLFWALFLSLLSLSLSFIIIYEFITISITIIITIIIIIDHVCYKTRFGGEVMCVLFERHLLPFLIRSDLIGKPYSVNMFVAFCLCNIFVTMCCFLKYCFCASLASSSWC